MRLRIASKALASLAACLLAACAAPSTADEMRGSPASRLAERETVNDTLGVRARGWSDRGKMTGTWTFSSPERVKVAEITYKDGQPSGPYRFYFDVLPFPRAFGKVRSAGELQEGKPVGRHVIYTKDGRVFSDATFEAGRIVNVRTGPRKTAVEATTVDVRLVETLDYAIRPGSR